MNKKIIMFLSALFVFGLVAVYAFNIAQTTRTAAKTNASGTENSHKTDHCKMKTESASNEGEKHSCAMADCCKDGKCKMGGACCGKSDSCPMKDDKDSKANVEMTGIDMTNVTIARSESCCQSGASCCDGGSGGGECCKKDKN